MYVLCFEICLYIWLQFTVYFYLTLMVGCHGNEGDCHGDGCKPSDDMKLVKLVPLFTVRKAFWLERSVVICSSLPPYSAVFPHKAKTKTD